VAPDMEAGKISEEIFSKLSDYRPRPQITEVGQVLSSGDGIVRISGLPHAVAGEMLEIGKGTYALALNLEEDHIGAIVLGDATCVLEGDMATRTGRILQVPVGEGLAGRIVDPLGRPLDGQGPIEAKEYRPLEFEAPEVVDRQPVKEPLPTGIKAIDALVPLGRGQRELVVSDRRIGKTAILVDTILNQRHKGIYCILVIIGQKTSTVAKIAEKLHQYDSMDYTTIVLAGAQETAAIQYLAPYAGCAMGEYFMYNGQHAVIMYDDLSKHAVAYREISLLLRRPPGREAYPGDIFYLHSRLLERSAKLSDKLGAGSLTAIPVVEVKGGDISGYIPTNLISITDGQFYLDTDMFNAGIRPAVNPSISVSRVGSDAQTPAMRKVAAQLRLDLAQYRDIETFAKFGTELHAETKKQVERGKRIEEVLKQKQYQPLETEDQVLILFALTRGYLDEVGLQDIERFEKDYIAYVHHSYPQVIEQLHQTGDMDKKTEGLIRESLDKFVSTFARPQD